MTVLLSKVVEHFADIYLPWVEILLIAVEIFKNIIEMLMLSQQDNVASHRSIINMSSISGRSLDWPVWSPSAGFDLQVKVTTLLKTHLDISHVTDELIKQEAGGGASELLIRIRAASLKCTSNMYWSKSILCEVINRKLLFDIVS